MITFIATAYNETKEAMPFLYCLLAQDNPSWKCIVYIDGPNDWLVKAINKLNDDRFIIKQNETNTGSWGHYNRIDALNTMVDTKWVLQSSIQDYYIPTTVSKLLSINKDYDMIYFNMVHHHFPNGLLMTKPIRCQIDWGSFIVKTSIAKEVGIDDPTSHICDGLFVEKLVKQNIAIAKLNDILVIHN